MEGHCIRSLFFLSSFRGDFGPRRYPSTCFLSAAATLFYTPACFGWLFLFPSFFFLHSKSSGEGLLVFFPPCEISKPPILCLNTIFSLLRAATPSVHAFSPSLTPPSPRGFCNVVFPPQRGPSLCGLSFPSLRRPVDVFLLGRAAAASESCFLPSSPPPS